MGKFQSSNWTTSWSVRRVIANFMDFPMFGYLKWRNKVTDMETVLDTNTCHCYSHKRHSSPPAGKLRLHRMLSDAPPIPWVGSSSIPAEWKMVVVLRCASNLAWWKLSFPDVVRIKMLRCMEGVLLSQASCNAGNTHWVVQGDRCGTRQDTRMGSFVWDVSRKPRKRDMSRPPHPPWISPILSALGFRFDLLLSSKVLEFRYIFKSVLLLFKTCRTSL